MYRSLLAFFVSAPLFAAPGTKEKEGVLYHPIKVGSKRVLVSTGAGAPGAEAIETTETVTKVEEKDSIYRVTIEREFQTKNVKKSTSVVMEVSGKGIARLTDRGVDLPEAAVLLKLPAKAGDTWVSEAPRGGKITFTTGKEEEIEVPAGKYKARLVVNEMTLNGNPVKVTSWFAQEVGLVKSVAVFNGVETTLVLKSFTPGK